MTNSIDPDQTASMFASILKLVSNVRQLFAADDFSRRLFSDAFFLGALRVKPCCMYTSHIVVLMAKILLSKPDLCLHMYYILFCTLCSIVKVFLGCRKTHLIFDYTGYW